MALIKSKQWVYDHLICEFDHWDCCKKGLVKDGDEYFVCILTTGYIKDIDGPVEYDLYPIDLNDTHHEFLRDYKEAFPWWFTGGKTDFAADFDEKIRLFKKKWPRNPIARDAEGGAR